MRNLIRRIEALETESAAKWDDYDAVMRRLANIERILTPEQKESLWELAKLPATPAGEPSTETSTTPTCESTGAAVAYAERLAQSMADKHYPGPPSFEPLTGDLMGLLTQIDNMTTGLVRDSCESTEDDPFHIPDHLKRTRHEA